MNVDFVENKQLSFVNYNVEKEKIMKLVYLNVKGYHNYENVEFEVDFRLSK